MSFSIFVLINDNKVIAIILIESEKVKLELVPIETMNLSFTLSRPVTFPKHSILRNSYYCKRYYFYLLGLL